MSDPVTGGPEPELVRDYDAELEGYRAALAKERQARKAAEAQVAELETDIAHGLTMDAAKLTPRLAAAEAVVAKIAQYHPDWKGQRVNDEPSRAKLIQIAWDAHQEVTE